MLLLFIIIAGFAAIVFGPLAFFMFRSRRPVLGAIAAVIAFVSLLFVAIKTLSIVIVLLLGAILFAVLAFFCFRWRRYAPGVVFGLISLFLLIADIKAFQFRKMMAAGANVSMPPESVASAEVVEKEWPAVLKAVGSITPVQGAMLSAEVPGVIADALRWQSWNSSGQRRSDCSGRFSGRSVAIHRSGLCRFFDSAAKGCRTIGRPGGHRPDRLVPGS
jgi:hypothetical protein